MFCHNCGQDVTQGQKYCSACGYNLSGKNLFFSGIDNFNSRQKKIAFSVVVLLLSGITIGGAQVLDSDGDGVFVWADNCPDVSNKNQADNDVSMGKDGGDSCDEDDDNDGYTDDIEQRCISDPFNSEDVPINTDGDNYCDELDYDDDNDGFDDKIDLFPFDPEEWEDTDNDGIGNNADDDDDNDGVLDQFDPFPLNQLEWEDTDNDGVGNNADADDDDDGWIDSKEIRCYTNPLDASETPTDFDSDGLCDLEDPDYDNNGIIDDEEVVGCMDPLASNYDSTANIEGPCSYYGNELNFEFVESAWDPIIPNLIGGEMCDVIISAMTKTDERDQVVDFTRSYYTTSQGVIGATGAASISDVAELNVEGTVIAVQIGTVSEYYALYYLNLATIVAYDYFSSIIAAVSNGEAHYAMGDTSMLAYQRPILTTFNEENFGIAVREESQLLLQALNAAISKMVNTGELDLIWNHWFDGHMFLTQDGILPQPGYPTPEYGSDLSRILGSGELKICTDVYYPPFESYDNDGNLVGFDVDFANALVEEIAEHYMGTYNPFFDPPISPDETIKIGFLNDASGPISQFAAPFTFAWGAAMDDLNAMGDDYVFEVIEADSGCDGEMAGTAAQSLVDAGVVAVVGAACSGASMGANAVLAAAGIPMVSYASTSPALSDATAYPHFYRIVPSDALQGEAVADMIMASGAENTAVG